MKNPYLMTHVMNHLHTNALFFDSKKNLKGKICDDFAFPDDPVGQALIAHPLIDEHIQANHAPMIFSVDGQLVYGWIPMDEEFCLLGPLRLSEDLSFRCRMELPAELQPNPKMLRDLKKEAPLCSVSLLAEDMVLLYQMEHCAADHDAGLDVRQLMEANFGTTQLDQQVTKELYQNIFEKVEAGFAHNPYNHEQRECACIRRGDVEGLRRILAERFPGRYGTLSLDSVRQEVYLGIVTITLASRAAIEGGLHYELSYHLSDVSVQKMDACLMAEGEANINEIVSIYRNAQLRYAELVHDLPIKKVGDTTTIENRHISHCKDYIYVHLHEKLTVQDIAQAIGLDANYLSSLFRKQEKVSLKQFIMYEKINRAKVMLEFSGLSLAEIAFNLGFASQSHMGKEFKKVTGMTAREYRLAYSKDDFVRESLAFPTSND